MVRLESDKKTAFYVLLSFSQFPNSCYFVELQKRWGLGDNSVVISSPGQSPGRAVVLPSALAVVSALARC